MAPAEHRLRNRLIACLVPLSLLWSTSLSTAGWLMSMVMVTPPVDSVIRAASDAAQVVHEQMSEYETCVELQAAVCAMDLQNVERGLRSILTEAVASNAAKLSVAEKAALGCSTAVSGLKASLRGWYKLDQDIPLTCPEGSPGAKAVNSVVNAKYIQYRDEIIEAYNTSGMLMANISAEIVSTLSDYAISRTNYDERYIYNITEQLGIAELGIPQNLEAVLNETAADLQRRIDNLAATIADISVCSTMQDSTVDSYAVCNLPKNAREQAELLQRSLENQLSLARDGFAAYANTFQTYKGNVVEAYENMKYYYESSQAILQYIIGDAMINALLQAAGITFGDWMDMDLVDFQSVVPSLPSGFAIIDNIPGLPVTLDEIWESTSELFYGAQNATAELGEALIAYSEELKRAIEVDVSAYFDGLEEYDPPRYCEYAKNATFETICIQDDEERYLVANTDMVGNATEALERLNALVLEYEGDQEEEPKMTIDFDIDLEPPSRPGLSSNSEFSIEALYPGGINLGKILFSFSFVWNLLVMGDMLLRGLRSVRLLEKFWSRGGLMMPPADVRADQAKRDETATWTKEALSTNMWQIIAHPIVHAAIGGAFVAFLLYQIVMIYKPIYRTYGEVCTTGGHSVATSGGTILTENLYSVAYNFASVSGYQKQSTAISSHDTTREDMCNSLTAGAQNSITQTAIKLGYYTSTINDGAEDMNLLGGCINTELLDNEFQNACCGLDSYLPCESDITKEGASCPLDVLGQPMPPVGSFVSNHSCFTNTSDWNVNMDQNIGCDKLPNCHISCKGPNIELLQASTHSAGCMLEWAIHSAWLKLGLTIVAYILMNVSRSLLVGAVIKVYWASGEILLPPTEESITGKKFVPQGIHGLQKVVQSRLGVTVRAWEKFAFLQGVIGILICIPWIWALAKWDFTGLAYKP